MAITARGRVGQWKEALDLLDEMDKTVMPQLQSRTMWQSRRSSALTSPKRRRFY